VKLGVDTPTPKEYKINMPYKDPKKRAEASKRSKDKKHKEMCDAGYVLRKFWIQPWMAAGIKKIISLPTQKAKELFEELDNYEG